MPSEQEQSIAVVAKAMREAVIRDDEGEFPRLFDMLDFSGENKAHTVVNGLARAAVEALATLSNQMDGDKALAAEPFEVTASMIVWEGGDEPSDYDGGKVLRRNGRVDYPTGPYAWKHDTRWPTQDPYDIIAYTPKAGTGDAAFLKDLARRLRDVPAVHVDGGDIDELLRIAAALATPAPDKALMPEAAVGAINFLESLLPKFSSDPLLQEVIESHVYQARRSLTTPTPVEEPANAATGEVLASLVAVLPAPTSAHTLAYSDAYNRAKAALAATNAGQVEAHGHDWWLSVAKLAGKHGVRYQTNSRLEDFLVAIAALTNGQATGESK